MTNMRIWDAVSKTNPNHTKKVNQRGGFTAINANSQVMAATKQFGPVGEGWGYTAGAPLFTPADQIIVPVTLWHGNRENVFGPEYGCAEYITAKGQRDDDAPKKATTDALTKLLSRLGFNADVFLGLYDDQKYVASLAQEFSEKPPVISEAQRLELVALFDGLKINPAPYLAKATENAGIPVTDLRDLPLSEFAELKKHLETKKPKGTTNA